MAEIKSYPNNADEFIGAEYPMKWHHGRTKGVFGADSNVAVAAVSGQMQVTVADGVGWLTDENGNGIVWWNDAEAQTAQKLTLDIDTADGVQNRIDRVIVEWSTPNFSAKPEIKILKGTNAVTPAAPALTNTASVRQISLAQIKIDAGTLAITADLITDERINADVCGIVTETTTVDTSAANDQLLALIALLREATESIIAGAVPPHHFTHEQGGTDEVDMDATVTITLSATDGGSLVGQTITVKNAEDEMVIETVTYDGQPATVSIPIAMQYKIEVSPKTGYVTPAPVQYTAVANSTRAVTMSYQYGRRYGFKRAKGNSSPSARIEYIHNAVGMTPGALSGGSFGYGDWEDFVEEIARPVMLNYNGSVAYELDHSDQTKKKSDGTASDITSTAFGGNAMVEFSKFKWVKRYEDTTYEYVIFCDVQFDSTYHAYAHTNEQGDVQDAFYWRMYKGSNVSSKLRSIAGQGVMVSQTRATERSYAQANGSGWDTIYFSGWQFIADLLTLIAKSDDCQTAYGAGRSAAGNSAGITPGSLKDTGAFAGATSGTTSVKTLWIEDFWGNYWEGMTGLILDGANGIKTKMTPPYKLTGAGYTATGITPTGTSGGYIDTEKVNDESGLVPKTANGSGSTYLADGLWFNTSQVDYAFVGGTWSNALLCGSRFVNLSNLASATNTDIGSGLSYLKPTA